MLLTQKLLLYQYINNNLNVTNIIVGKYPKRVKNLCVMDQRDYLSATSSDSNYLDVDEFIQSASRESRGHNASDIGIDRTPENKPYCRRDGSIPQYGRDGIIPQYGRDGIIPQYGRDGSIPQYGLRPAQSNLYQSVDYPVYGPGYSHYRPPPEIYIQGDRASEMYLQGEVKRLREEKSILREIVEKGDLENIKLRKQRERLEKDNEFLEVQYKEKTRLLAYEVERSAYISKCVDSEERVHIVKYIMNRETMPRKINGKTHYIPMKKPPLNFIIKNKRYLELPPGSTVRVNSHDYYVCSVNREHEEVEYYYAGVGAKKGYFKCFGCEGDYRSLYDILGHFYDCICYCLTSNSSKDIKFVPFIKILYYDTSRSAWVDYHHVLHTIEMQRRHLREKRTASDEKCSSKGESRDTTRSRDEPEDKVRVREESKDTNGTNKKESAKDMEDKESKDKESKEIDFIPFDDPKSVKCFDESGVLGKRKREEEIPPNDKKQKIDEDDFPITE